MAYFTGTVNSFGDLKAVIENAAVAVGWTLADGVLSKYGHYVKLVTGNYGSTSYPYLLINAGTDQSGSTLTGQVGAGAKMYSSKKMLLSWPGTYHIHAFDREIYCFLNSNVDLYQTLAFGVSNMPGIGGTGGWYGSMAPSSANQNQDDGDQLTYITVFSPDSLNIGVDGYSYYPLGSPFWCRNAGGNEEIGAPCAQINIGLEYGRWYSPKDFGIRSIASLLLALPTNLNGGHVLLPAKCVVHRPSQGRTIALQHEHLRWIRNDLLENEQIIQYGSDKWKCYPVLRRNTAQRNGGQGITHSGTFGYAVRYDGP